MLAMRMYRHGQVMDRQVAFVYDVSPPVDWTEYTDVDGEYTEIPRTSDYVWVSAVNVPYSGPETYAFPCDWTGHVLSWGELPMSRKGKYHPDQILAQAGYSVEDASEEFAFATFLIAAAAHVVRFWRDDVMSALERLYAKIRK